MHMKLELAWFPTARLTRASYYTISCRYLTRPSVLFQFRWAFYFIDTGDKMKKLVQDPDAKSIYIVWYEREAYHDENPLEEHWEYMIYFDKHDYKEDLEYIRDRYSNIKVRMYKLLDSFESKEPMIIRKSLN